MAFHYCCNPLLAGIASEKKQAGVQNGWGGGRGGNNDNDNFQLAPPPTNLPHVSLRNNMRIMYQMRMPWLINDGALWCEGLSGLLDVLSNIVT